MDWVVKRVEKGKERKWKLLLSEDQMHQVEGLLDSHEASLIYHQLPLLSTMNGARHAKALRKAFVSALKQQVKK